MSGTNVDDSRLHCGDFDHIALRALDKNWVGAFRFAAERSRVIVVVLGTSRGLLDVRRIQIHPVFQLRLITQIRETTDAHPRRCMMHNT